MSDFPATEAFQGFLYAALCIASLGVMGITAEGCDILKERQDAGDIALSVDTCPNRNVAVIVFAILVFLLALPMFIAYAFEVSFLKRIEIFLVLGILVFNFVETGIGSSPRTAGFNLFVGELTWWSLILALAAFFLALSSSDRPKFEVKFKKDPEAAAPSPVATAPPTAEGAQPTYTAPPPQPTA